jgi:hypothetical protein
VVDALDPVLSQAAIMLLFGCLVLFLWPRIVVLEDNYALLTDPKIH